MPVKSEDRARINVLETRLDQTRLRLADDRQKVPRFTLGAVFMLRARVGRVLSS